MYLNEKPHGKTITAGLKATMKDGLYTCGAISGGLLITGPVV